MEHRIVLSIGFFLVLSVIMISTTTDAFPRRRYDETNGGGGEGVGVREPFRMERINRALSTILNGVRSGSLENILRGSFMFTRNNNVRGVSDTVISSVFGTPVRGEGNIDAFGNRINPDGGSSASSSASASTLNNNNNNNNNAFNNAVGSSARSSARSRT